MDKAKISEEIQKILDVSKVGVLSTSHNNVPNSRYMVFYHDEAILYTKTDEDSPKVEEVESNPQAHILLGYEETKKIKASWKSEQRQRLSMIRKLLTGYGKHRIRPTLTQKKIRI